MDQIRRIPRPTDVPDSGIICDLLWSDPDKDIEGWGENDRGVSFTFGGDVVAKVRTEKHQLLRSPFQWAFGSSSVMHPSLSFMLRHP